MRKRLPVTSVWLTGLLTMAQGAAAQDAATSTPSALEEVVVTALKRTERLQDVPVSISALSGDAIAEQKIDSPHSLAAIIPNLQTANAAGGSNVIYSLRGVSLTDVSPNQRGPIALYYDEAYRGASALQGINLFDLERVEVLRGPQGTLYGMNATGGAINFVSRLPDYETEGYISAGVGNFNRREAAGALQLPLVDGRLAARVAFTYLEADGYFENRLPGKEDFNSTDEWGIRASFRLDATDDLQFVLRLDASEQDATNFGGRISVLDPVEVPNTCAGFGAGVGCGFFAPPYYPDGLGEWETESNFVPHFKNETRSVALTTTWSATDTLEFTSVTSYVRGEINAPQENDGSPLRIFEAPKLGGTTRQFAQDLRLATDFEGPLDFILGAYYNREEMDTGQYIQLFGEAGGSCDLLAGAACAGINDYEQTKKDIAGYLDAAYELTDRVTLRGGVRFTRDEGELENYTGGFFDLDGTNPYLFGADLDTCLAFGFSSAPCPGLNGASASYSNDETSGRVGIDFQVTPDALVYLGWSRGFRGAAFNNNALNDASEIEPTKPETLDSIEAGVKTQWLDRTLTINGAVYHYAYENQQAASQVGPFYILYSIPESTIVGGELEATWRPDPRLRLHASVGITDGTIDRAEVSGVDVEGNRLPLTSKTTGAVGFDWDVINGGRGVVSLGVDANYSSRKYFDLQNTERLVQGSYTIVNGRVRWHDVDDRFSVNVWGRNLTNEYYYTQNFDLSLYGIDWGNVAAPRTYGVTLEYKF